MERTEVILKTAEVAKLLGIGKRRLHRKLESGRFPVPKQNPENGYYEWRPVDIQLFQQALAQETR